MPPRYPEREMNKKIRVSITLDKDIWDFVEYGIKMRWWPNRSAGINMLIASIMTQRQQENQQQPRQYGNTDGGNSRSTQRESTEHQTGWKQRW